MIYSIVKYGQPVLERRGADITEFDTPELRQLIEDMFDSMYAAKGVGLAAPQIGIAKRLAVIDTTTGEDEGQKIVLINPEIVKMEGTQKSEEGCLSLPTFREQVNRPRKVTVRAQDVTGTWFEVEGNELLARAMQHEIDHLDGVLFIDRLSRLKRDLVIRKIKKLIKNGEW